MLLEGLLVDLVPFNKVFRDLEHTWRNNEAAFWGSGGGRWFVTRASLERHMSEWLEEKEHGQAGIAFGMKTKDGKPIGGMFLNWLVPHHRFTMLGAKIGEPDYWGGGYGTDALLLVIDYAFDWLDLHKVWLSTTAANARVMRQMEKVGFMLESRTRSEMWMDGEWVDGLVYGLLREEWPGREAMIAKLGLKAKV